MTTDESFDTRSFGTGLDYPPSRDGGEPATLDMIPTSDMPEQRPALYLSPCAVAIYQLQCGTANIQYLAATLLILFTQFYPERRFLYISNIDRDNFRKSQQTIAHQSYQHCISKPRDCFIRFGKGNNPITSVPVEAQQKVSWIQFVTVFQRWDLHPLKLYSYSALST